MTQQNAGANILGISFVHTRVRSWVGPAFCADFPGQAEQQSHIGPKSFRHRPGILFGFAGMRMIERGEQFPTISE